MARNQEKANSMLARFREAQAIELGLKRKTPLRRPFDPESVNNVRACLRWRIDLIKEVTKKIAQIQNPGLSEYQLRNTNDDINKLLREKEHWQKRIIQLGGPDFFKTQPAEADQEGFEVPGGKGYKYFGRARELPGVKDLLEQNASVIAPPKTRAELQKNVDADYYGFRDDEDGLLFSLEASAEEKARKQALLEFEAGGSLKRKAPSGEEPAAAGEIAKSSLSAVTLNEAEQESLKPVNIPSQKEVEQYLLDRRKRELLDRYVSDEQRQQDAIVKDLVKTKSAAH